jgi:hypothetical protein
MRLESKHPRPALGYQVEIVEGEIILFHPAKTKILYGNLSSALIWRLCDGQRSVAEIVQLLSAAYPEVAQTMEADVKETLLTFAQHGAIEWV